MSNVFENEPRSRYFIFLFYHEHPDRQAMFLFHFSYGRILRDTEDDGVITLKGARLDN